MARSFQPLRSKLIYDYERIPESASVEPEKDPVRAEDTILSEDARPGGPGREKNPRLEKIFVEVEKGNILNGIERDGFHVFEVVS